MLAPKNLEHQPTTQLHPNLQVFLQWCTDPDMQHQICQLQLLEWAMVDKPGLVVVVCGIAWDSNTPIKNIEG